jgi:integrase
MKGHASASRTLTALKAALNLAVKNRLVSPAGRIRKVRLKAVMYTGCRAGELTKARRSAFDARTNSLTVTGKTGTRAIPLAPVAVEFFTQISKDKLPNAWLLTRDDGKPWAHSDWDELVKEVVARAELPTVT